MKWCFSCGDSSIRFSVLFIDPQGEASTVQDAYRVKADGRYDM